MAAKSRLGGNDRLLLFDDEPIRSASDDKLHHRDIAATLHRVAVSRLQAERPFNIALYGSWGSGKSSVVNLLGEQLNNDHRLRLVTFDVWRHASDSIRRQFLLFLDGPDGLDTGLGLERNLDASVSSVGMKTRVLLWPLLVSLALAVIVLIFNNYILLGGSSSIWQSAALGLLAYVALTLGQGLERNVVVSLPVTTTYHRLDQPDQFARKFRDIIAAFRKQARPKQHLIIVFDNMDRCSPDVACDTLTMVKTFLDHEGCTYLVPCDETALRDHLTRRTGVQSCDFVDEYLRKFFHMTVRMPPVSKGDVLEYSAGLVSRAGLPNDVAKVVASAHIDNPRRMKHVLNDLMAVSCLAAQREEDGLLDEGTVTAGTAFLAKTEVIRSLWPKAYELLELDPENLTRMNDWVTGRDPQALSHGPGEIQTSLDGFMDPEKAALRHFLLSTIDVNAADVGAFVRLFELPHRRGLPDSREFIDRVFLRTDVAYVESKLLEPDLGARYFLALEQEADDWLRKGYPDVTFNAVYVAVAVYGRLQPTMKTQARKFIKDKLGATDVRTRIWNLDTGNLLDALCDEPTADALDLLLFLTARLGELSGTPPTHEQRRLVVRKLVHSRTELRAAAGKVYESAQSGIASAAQSDAGRPLVEEASPREDSDAQAALVPDGAITAVIGRLWKAGHHLDPDVKDLLLRLARTSQDGSKLAVMQKCSEVLRTETGDALKEPQRDVMELLGAFGPPTSCPPTTDTVSELRQAYERLDSDDDKLVVARVLLKFVGCCSKDEAQTVSAVLAHDVRSLGGRFPAALFENSRDDKTPLPEEIWNALRYLSMQTVTDRKLVEALLDHHANDVATIEAYYAQLLQLQWDNAMGILKDRSATEDKTQQPAALSASMRKLMVANIESTDLSNVPRKLKAAAPLLGTLVQQDVDRLAIMAMKVLRDSTDRSSAGNLDQTVQFLAAVEPSISLDTKAEAATQLLSKAKDSEQTMEEERGPGWWSKTVEACALLSTALPPNDRDGLADLLLRVVSNGAIQTDIRAAACRSLEMVPITRDRRRLVTDALRRESARVTQQSLKVAMEHCLTKVTDAG